MHPTHAPPPDDIYGGNRQDILFRCALLCKAALEAPFVVPCGGAPYGEDNLVFVANDWHASLLPVYLQVRCVYAWLGGGGGGGCGRGGGDARGMWGCGEEVWSAGV